MRHPVLGLGPHFACAGLFGIGLAISVVAKNTAPYMGYSLLLFVFLIFPAILLLSRNRFRPSFKFEQRLKKRLPWRYYVGALTDGLVWSFTFGFVLWAIGSRVQPSAAISAQVGQIAAAAVSFLLVGWFIYQRWANRLVYPNGANGVPDTKLPYKGWRSTPGNIQENILILLCILVGLAAIGEEPLYVGIPALVSVLSLTLVPAMLAAILLMVGYLRKRVQSIGPAPEVKL